MFKKIFELLEIDSHIAYSLLLRLWSIVAGAVLVFLIPTTLTPEQQGYYFTFSSLLATQVFFELGLNTVLLQVIGHERANIQFDEFGSPKGTAVHLNRFFSVFELVRKVYKITAFLFFIFAISVGIYFFKTNASTEIFHQDWFYTWIFLVLFTSFNLYLSPFLACLEGVGFISYVAKLRIKQSMVSSAVLWILLLTGFGLKSLIVVPAVSTFFSSVWLIKKYKWVFYSKNELAEVAQISWKKEIFPFQWRMAISWLSGYFIAQLINPIVFKKMGAIEAGKLGLALSVFTTIGALSFSWVNAKIPEMVKFVISLDSKNLKKVFLSVLVRSTLLNFVCCITFVFLIYFLKLNSITLADRIAPIPVLICLTIIGFVNSIIFTAATFMRAFKEEPMLFNSIVIAVFTVIATFLGASYSVFIIVLLHTAIALFISLPWTYILFRKYYERLNKDEFVKQSH